MKQIDKKTEVGNEQLKFISVVRFPLIIGVVFIHAWISKVNGVNLFDYHYFHGTPIVSHSLYPLYTNLAHLCSQIIPRISVPLFFFISGYLFFRNVADFSFTTYRQKIHRRIYSLFIPYVIWNLLALFIYILKKASAGEAYDLHSIDYLMAFWNFKGMYTPACLPFWFIRDLMVLVLLTPFIYKAIKVFKAYVLLILTCCWLSMFWVHIFELSCLSVYFFTLGAYASIHQVNFVSLSARYSKWCTSFYVISAIGILCFKHYDWSVYLLNANVLTGLVCCINGVVYLLRKKQCKVNHLLESSTFFVFAFHILLLDLMVGMVEKTTLLQSEFLLILIYFAIPVIAILISVLVYAFLHKHFSRLTNVITGGR